MNLNDFSYMDIYNHRLKTKKQFRDAIPADKITEATRQAWDLEDQREPLILRYYQMKERERLARIEKEDASTEVKFKSEVRVQR